MNNKVLVTIIIIFIFIGTFFTIMSCQKLKYSPGRDTYELFGDGTYQILVGPYQIYSLYEYGNINAIEDDIYRYRKISSLLYVVGKNGYTILNYETGITEQNSDIKKFSNNDQEMFRKEEKFKKLKK